MEAKTHKEVRAVIKEVAQEMCLAEGMANASYYCDKRVGGKRRRIFKFHASKAGPVLETRAALMKTVAERTGWTFGNTQHPCYHGIRTISVYHHS